MYPTEELAALALRKAELRGQIAASRLHCTVLAGQALRPIVWVDGMLVRWQKVPRFAKAAAIPLLLMLRRKLLGERIRRARAMLGWLPTVFDFVRTYLVGRAA